MSSPPDEDRHPVPPQYYPQLDPGQGQPAQGQPAQGGGRRPLIIALSTLVALGAGVLAVVLLVGGSDPAQRSAAPPAPATVTAPGAGRPLAAGMWTGTATLADPVIRVVKASPAAGQWCSLLSADDVRAATGFAQRGAPNHTSLCTHYLAADAGYLLVTDIPAFRGAAHTVRGNSAIIYQSDPTACEVTVALNRGGAVLDIDLRGVASPRASLCRAAADLAARAFDRLPPG